MPDIPADFAPINPTAPALSLVALAGQINAAHDSCETALRSSLTHAIAAGRLLVEAKGRVGHGGWLPWLGANCRMSVRMAQRYMRVAQRADQLTGPNASSVSHLSLTDALAALAGPVEPEKGANSTFNPEPLSADEQADLARHEATIAGCVPGVLTVGRGLLDLRAHLGPARFETWLADRFSADQLPSARAAMLAVETGCSTVGEVVGVYVETLGLV